MKAYLYILLIPLFFASCLTENRKIKKEEFEKVEIGMTIKEVKEIIGEPFEIRKSVDSFENYFYYTKKDLLTTKYAIVEFDKAGFVSSSHYENPD